MKPRTIEGPDGRRWKVEFTNPDGGVSFAGGPSGPVKKVLHLVFGDGKGRSIRGLKSHPLTADLEAFSDEELRLELAEALRYHQSLGSR